MESVSIKFQTEVVEEMDKNISLHHFNSRTEFIREAVRDKLENLKKEDLINEFLKFKGKANNKLSDKQLKKVREEVFDSLSN